MCLTTYEIITLPILSQRSRHVALKAKCLISIGDIITALGSELDACWAAGLATVGPGGPGTARTWERYSRCLRIIIFIAHNFR